MNMLALTIIFPLIGFVLLAFSRGRWSCLLYTSDAADEQ